MTPLHWELRLSAVPQSSQPNKPTPTPPLAALSGIVLGLTLRHFAYIASVLKFGTLAGLSALVRNQCAQNLLSYGRHVSLAFQIVQQQLDRFLQTPT